MAWLPEKPRRVEGDRDQAALIDFLSCGQGPFGDRFDLIRHLILAQTSFAQRRLDVQRIDRLTTFRLDENADALAQQLVWHTDCGGGMDTVKQTDCLFDLGRRNFFAAAVDLLLDTTFDSQIAIRVTTYQVAGTVKAILGKAGRVLYWCPEVATNRVRTPGQQLPDLTFRNVMVVLIDDSNLIFGGQGSPLGMDDRVQRIVQARVAQQPLGHAKDLLQFAADDIDQLPGQSRLQTGTSHLYQLEAG